MAFNYTFTLNGEPLDATIGVMVHDKLEEAMDENAIHLPITTLGHPYKIMGLLQITATDGTIEKSFNYIVISDEVQDVSKDGFYSHNLVALEYTHKLDKYFLSALAFTKPFLRKARAPFKYLDEDIPFGDILVNQLFPKVDFKEIYTIGEVFEVPQTTQAYVSYALNDDREVDVYITTNIPPYNFNLLHNLTNAPIQLNAGQFTGDYEFRVGMLIEGSFVPVYKHFVRVINERRYTLYDMIERVRAVVPIERESYHTQTRIFELNSNLENAFKQIEMPQMFYHNQSVRQVLNNMFKYINAISRLQHVNGVEDVLTVDYFNKIGVSFDDVDITSFNVTQDAQNYGTKAISFLTQTLQSNFRENPSVESPASELFKTVRSNDIQLTDSSFELKLEKPIYEINKLEVVIPNVSFRLDDTQNGSSFFFKNIQNYKLDLTSRFLEKTFWDLKTRTVDIITYPQEEAFNENVGMRLNQGGNLFWERNSNRIQTNIILGTVVKSTILQEVILEALNEEFTLGAYDEGFFNGTLDGDNQFDGVQDFPMYNPTIDIQGELSDISLLYRNLKFNIEYSTLDETVMQVDRSDLEDVEYESYLRMNNAMAVSDYGRTTRDFYGRLERSSNPIKTISKVHTDMSTVLDVGQIDELNYIIVERKLIFHNEFIEGIYIANKNHNRLNEFNGINQEYRAFEIPSYNQTIKRMDFYSDYIFIVKPTEIDKTPYIENDNTIFDFTNHYQDPFRHLREATHARRKATFALVRTDGFLEQYPDATNDYKGIITPVVSFGGKGGLNFNFKFNSNLVAGDALVKSGEGNIYNSPIWYTDNQGFFDKLWFAMGYDYDKTNDVVLDDIGELSEDYFNEGYGYPLVRSTTQSFLGQTTFIENGTVADPDWFIVYKDQATDYGFSYHLAILSLNPADYVIGQNFYSENPLVATFEKKKYLYIYDNLVTYNKFDDLKIKSGYNAAKTVELTTSNLTVSNYVYTFSGISQLSGATNWAIGDADGNLYMACNNNANGFKVISRHFRPNIRIIGETINQYSGFSTLTIATDVQATGQRGIVNDYAGAVSVDIATDIQAEGVYSKDSVGNASVIITTDVTASGVYAKDSSGTASVNIATNLAAVGVYFKNSSGTATASISTNMTAEGSYFKESVGDAEVIIYTNIVGIGTATTCEWVFDFATIESTDISQSPPCSSTAQKIECTFNKQTTFWECNWYEGVES